MSELKPCPFCGEAAEVKYIHWPVGMEGIDGWAVGCDGQYGSSCPGSLMKYAPLYFTEKDARNIWNRRANDGE